LTGFTRVEGLVSAGVTDTPVTAEGVPSVFFDLVRVEKAMVFGNLNDHDSEISQYLKKHAPKRLREDLGLEPKVYYRGI